MDLMNAINDLQRLAKRNSPEILTALGVSGVFITSYLSGKASVEATRMIESAEAISGTKDEKKERVKERAALVWRVYIPVVVSGGATIGCIIAANRTGSRRTTAAVTAYTLTDKAFSEYKDKVREQIGEHKEQKLQDELREERAASIGKREVIVTGRGDVLCCELYTGRYFMSDMETLKQAENEINYMVIHTLNVTLDEFYDKLGLAHTSKSDILGWDSDKLMELKFTPTLSEDNQPCLAFEYNYVKPL